MIARNVVERIFGIIKQRFAILKNPPKYSMEIQAQIFPALAAIHNFICIHDSEETNNFTDNIVNPHSNTRLGSLVTSIISSGERDQAKDRWDKIAQDMWGSYVAYLKNE